MFDASSSFDPDGTIVAFLWDFGDGEVAEGAVVRHVYEEPGVYEVVLFVEDDAGNGVEVKTVLVVHELAQRCP